MNDEIFIASAIIQLDMPYEVYVRVDGKHDKCYYFFGSMVTKAFKNISKDYKKQKSKGMEVKLQFIQFGHIIITIKL